tara:strand:- start:16 stop:666 length:651 start_codon:yes stop_codon:yes gene_type:complete
MSFKKNKYQVIRNAISKELANLAYSYLQISAEADHWMINNQMTHDKNPLVGNFKDKQVPGSYAKYADRLMETLLIKVIPIMKDKTNLNLIPTYSYTRLYRKGNILKRHKDRPSCEISTTLNLGGDNWDIFLDPTGTNNVIDEYKNIHKPNAPKGIKISLKPGDMLIYSGCELEHWREPFQGNLCGQVFLHYNHANGPYAKTNLYDKRPMLGIVKNG